MTRAGVLPGSSVAIGGVFCTPRMAVVAGERGGGNVGDTATDIQAVPGDPQELLPSESANMRARYFKMRMVLEDNPNLSGESIASQII